MWSSRLVPSLISAKHRLGVESHGQPEGSVSDKCLILFMGNLSDFLWMLPGSYIISS